MTRVEEINEAMLAEMWVHNIEDTTENRLIFLKGLQEGWREDTDTSIEKVFYQVALSGEIMRLEFKLMFPRIL